MHTQDIMHHYETIGELSAAMLAAARNSDWDGLAEAQQRCASAVDWLRVSGSPALNAQQRQRKHEIILRVLAEDAEVRSLAEPWMAELDQLLHGFKMNRDIGRTYR